MSKNNTTPTVPPLTLEQANELIYKLLDRIAELEDRLNQNSGNSSKPPSSDGPGGSPPTRQRPVSGKQRGAALHGGDQLQGHDMRSRIGRSQQRRWVHG